MENLKMLPEHLFTVGHSMQDISRDDFLISNGGEVPEHSLEKDMCPTIMYRIPNNSSLNNCGINSMQNCVDVKLEDISSTDLFPCHNTTWQQNPINTIHELNSHQMFPQESYDHNSNNVLLQGSDDPLISHGANNVLSNDDEHPADFAKSLIVQHDVGNEKILHRPVKSGCSNLTKQQLKVKANLMSAQNQQKRNQNNAATASEIITSASVIQKHQSALRAKKKKANTLKLRFHHQALPADYLSHYEASQAQQDSGKPNQTKISATQQRASSKSNSSSQKPTQSRNSNENVRSWLQKIAEIQRTANASKEKTVQNQKTIQQISYQTNKTNINTKESNLVLNTLSRADNSTDTRSHTNANGLPNTLASTDHAALHDDSICNSNAHNVVNSRRQTAYTDLPYMGEITLENCKPRRGRKPKKADICHLIYKNYGTIMPKKLKTENVLPSSNSEILQQQMIFEYEQPLNLCLRDQLLNDSYSISSGEELSETNSSCPTPVNNPNDCTRDTMLANSLKNSLSNINDAKQEDMLAETSVGMTLPIENDNHLIKPLTMYYQKLFESGMLLKYSNGPFKTIRKDNQLALKIPIPNDLLFPQKLPKILSSPVSAHNEYQDVGPVNPITSTLNSASQQQQAASQKKKRSAIFIPPMNIENTNNPATEVSICKFKFTGGSKPTLQEKKMISVDAGGNYRYFSGTGDKASRGFEYFPRESLQHTAGLLPGVNCTVQKLPSDIISPAPADLNNELLQMSESAVIPPIVISDTHR